MKIWSKVVPGNTVWEDLVKEAGVANGKGIINSVSVPSVGNFLIIGTVDRVTGNGVCNIMVDDGLFEAFFWSKEV